jgi:hypothetical protein
VSTGSVTPAVVTGATVFPSGADPIARFHQRVLAELELAEVERAVRRLGRHLDPKPVHRPSVSRRLRRSAWCPSD